MVESPYPTLEPLQVGQTLVEFRPSAGTDREFLFQVYASTRAEELASVPWSSEQKTSFLRQQFEAQDHAYRNNYAGACFYTLVVNGAPAGRLYLHQRSRELRIMDMALLPEFRNRGIGGAVLRKLMHEAGPACAVSIHVEAFNPAKRLYERLGFVPVSLGSVYLLMEWRPPGWSSQPQ